IRYMNYDGKQRKGVITMDKAEKLVDQLERHDAEACIVSGVWNIRYLSAFTGSKGVILITGNEKLLITDYRYYEQAGQQTDFEIVLHSGHTGHKGKVY